ncbi:hypothetical protein D3C71_1406020 [compost metagenome]
MCATDFLLQERSRIGVARVDGDGRAQALGEPELAVVDIHRRHVQPHRLGVLHGHVAQATDAGNHHPVAGLGVGDLQALVHSDARAQDRRDIDEAHFLGQMADVIGIGQRVFRETTVHRIAAVLLRFAQRFPAAQTVLAIAAGRVQPRNADAVAFLDVGDAGTYRDHMANAFVAGNEWRIGLDRPVALHRVQIGVAHATGFDLD